MQQVFRIFIFIIILFVINQGIAQSIRFQKTYGPQTFIPGKKTNEASFYDVETLSDDGFATLGFLTDTLTPQHSEGFISRYDCTGHVLWTKTLGASGAPTNTNAGIVETPEGDIVFSFNLGTGFFRASILAGKISKTGQVIWMKRIGNNTEFGRDIVQTPDGGFVIVGNTAFHGTDNTAADIYIVKLDSNGNVLWSKTFGNPAGTYDEAYAVKLDSRENLIVTGRCIADATFQAFILKADPGGNPIAFKTYGYNNQRTNAFDLLVDAQDHYLITGFTTILEADHTSSESDPFLIKVDSSMNTVFANVYEVNNGRDFSTIGEGLALLDNGDYAIGVSTSSFSAHDISGPSAPNKNALYVIKNDGSIRKAFLYNMHGSQYTRVRKSSMGSVLLGGFSRAYTDKNISQGLIIKTDRQFLSGCFDIDVTSELAVYKPIWQISDFSYQTKSGHRLIDYINYKDSLLKEFTLCEEIPLLTPEFDIPAKVCPGEVQFIDQSAGPGTGYWIVDRDTIYQDGDLKYVFQNPGFYSITRVLQFSCVVKSLTKRLEVQTGFIDTLFASICEGTGFTFKGKIFNKEGIHLISIPGQGGICDSIFIIDLKIIKGTTSKLSQNYCGKEFKFNNNTYTNPGTYQILFKSQDGCDSLNLELVLSKTYQTDTIIDLDTVFFCEHFRYGDTILTKPGTYKNLAFDTIDDCAIKYFNVVLIDDCDCLKFPNVFTPDNGDQLNNDFRPANKCGDVIEDYKIKIYNRWGQNIYTYGGNYKIGWDGMYKSLPAPIETYMYQVEYKIRYVKDDPPVTKQKSGSFSLIR